MERDEDTLDSPSSDAATLAQGVLRPLGAMALLFIFLVGVQGLSSGIKGIGGGTLDSFMVAVENPFLGLVTGILATTLVQSSSVTTSLIVGMVAGGVLSFSAAVPMVMGANIGTTVTNTIAALAQVGRKSEFRRAFAAATCHDFFNYLAVLVFLPLEIMTGVLQKSAIWLSGLLPSTGGMAYKSPLKSALKSSVKAMDATITWITVNDLAQSIIMIVVSVALIFFALSFIVKLMRGLVLSRMQGVLRRVLSRGAAGSAAGLGLGALITVLVQSSSITTSIMVPLAGAGLVRLWQVFPVTVGANIGTTVTALLASMAITGGNAEVARQVALTHLLFNVAGMLVFYVPPFTRQIPMYLARRLSFVAAKSKRVALAYVVGAFYGVPALMVFLFR